MGVEPVGLGGELQVTAEELAAKSQELSDQAVRDGDAERAFAFRDAARVWTLIAKVRENITDEERDELKRLAHQLIKAANTEAVRGDE